MNAAPEKTISEFFAGIGLMRIGLENAGWRIAFANDINHDKWSKHRSRFGNKEIFILGMNKMTASQCVSDLNHQA